MKFYSGFELERKFAEMLSENEKKYIYESQDERDKEPFIILFWNWISYDGEHTLDFLVKLACPTRYIFVDVVGCYEKNGVIKLNTSHKDYARYIKFLKDDGCNEGYLAFMQGTDWKFLRVSEALPKGDITLTKGRSKHVRNIETVFKADIDDEIDAPEDEILDIEIFPGASSENTPLEICYN